MIRPRLLALEVFSAFAIVAFISGCSQNSSTGTSKPRVTTPLHLAAANGEIEGVEDLIAGGADAGALDESGRTPLHLAAANGHGRTVGALLAAGADPNVLDDSGRLARELAVEAGHDETAARLAAVTKPTGGSKVNRTATAATPKVGINPSLKYRDAASFERAIGEPALMLSGKSVHILAAKRHDDAARIVLPYLERAYAELFAIVGMKPDYDLVVLHFPSGHSEAFGGTSNGTLWYDDANLRLNEHEEWREFQIPHVSGYIEEMAHNFVSAAHVQFGWEMVGWSIGAKASAKVAGNPSFNASVANTRDGQADTYERYVAGGYVFPADIAPNQVDRIHAHLLWVAEQKYGPNFWRDYFAEVKKVQPELIKAGKIGDMNENRNARYVLSWQCFDRLPGVDFRRVLESNRISLVTDIKALDPEAPGWNRRLE